MILATGATGNVGRGLVDALRRRNAPVRALVRDAARSLPQGIEKVVGDLDRPETLAAALAGVDRAFLLASHPAQEAGFIKAAQAAGVKHVVMLSSAGVPHGVASGPLHAPGEELLRRSGLDWTILRPYEFMSNALRWLPMIRAQGAVFDPVGDGTTPLIDPADIGAVAAELLAEGSGAGETYDLTGPEAISRAEMIAEISGAIGRPLRYVAIPSAEFEKQLRERGMPEALVGPMAAYYGMIKDGRLETVSPVVEDLLGRKARTFADWVQANAAAFA